PSYFPAYCSWAPVLRIVSTTFFSFMLCSSASSPDIQLYSVRERCPCEWYLALLRSSPEGTDQDSLPVAFVVQRVIFAWRVSRGKAPSFKSSSWNFRIS